MKKKVFAILLVIAMLLGIVAGCGPKEKEDPPKPDDSKPEQSEQVEQTDGEKELKKLGLLTYSLGEEFGVDILHSSSRRKTRLYHHCTGSFRRFAEADRTA